MLLLATVEELTVGLEKRFGQVNSQLQEATGRVWANEQNFDALSDDFRVLTGRVEQLSGETQQSFQAVKALE